MNYNLDLSLVELGILLKFQKLKNKVLKGKDDIKGNGGLEPDKYVPEKHILHCLIRGFYKPKGFDSIRSYKATESEDNYGKQIQWLDKENGEFKKIIVKPPSRANDNRASSDINAVRYTMEHKIPIGIFETQGPGVNRSLGLGVFVEEDKDGNFIIKPLEISEEEIMSKIKEKQVEDRNYFSFRTKDPELVNDVLAGTKEIEFNSIYNHYDKTKVNDVVFLVLGGDNPGWELGLKGISLVTKNPYDRGYDSESPRNYKVDLEIKILFPTPITREDMIPYRNAYDMTFIGPMTKGEPNQANSSLEEDQIPSLIRAILDIYPEFREQVKLIFGEYILNKADNETDILTYENDTNRSEYEFEENFIKDDIPRNRLIYGAPGTGKSYKLNEEAEKMFPNEILRKRVTFYPRYSYSQFIGMYKPSPLYIETDKQVYCSDEVTLKENNLEPSIEYTFVPGPLIEMLVKALNNKKHNFLLIIEEINRAEAAAVFGDVFQILDRKDSGESQYSITFNPDVMSYLRTKGIYDQSIKLPENLYIWATMNNSDQGVLHMDAAFKRRWSFEYLPLNEKESKVDDIYIKLHFLDNDVKWNDFRKVINSKLKKIPVPEDKLIGPFFLSRKELKNEMTFKNKLLLYLRDDVLRHNPQMIFKNFNFSDIIENYDLGKEIFNFDLEQELNENE